MATRSGASGPWGGAVCRRVREEARNGWLPGLTVLTGADLHHLDLALRSILDALVPEDERSFGMTVLEGGPVPVAEVVAAARSAGMFARERVVLVRDPGTLEGDPSALESYAAKPPAGSHILVRAPKLDRKRKLHAALATAGRTLEFQPPGPRDQADARREIAAMARERGIVLDPEATEFLLSLTSGDFLRISTELDKMRDWAGERNRPLTAEEVRDLAPGSEAASGFEIAEAFLRRDRAAALAWTRRLLSAGEEPLRLLGSVSWRARTLLHGKALSESGASAAEIVAALKAWRLASDLPRLVQAHELPDLLRQPAALLAADRALKGRILGPRTILESLVEGLTPVAEATKELL